MKVLHVFSDEKFIDRHIKVYEGSDITNEFAILKKTHTYMGKYKKSILHVYPGNNAYTKLCEDKFSYDAVIVYFLDEYKIRLINDLKNPNTKIIWSFYGAEIYSLPSLKYYFLSKDTQGLLGYFRFGLNIDLLKIRLKNLLLKIKGRTPFPEQLKQACGSIDFFLWYNAFEYEFLNSKLEFKLPAFFQAVFSDNIGDLIPPNKKQNKTIMIGNSRSPYNNHVDVLNILKKTPYFDNVIIPFSYGTNSRYVDRLRHLFKDCQQFKTTFIEDYITFEEYVEIVNNCSAVIFNSFRQMALGNILIAIRFGVKIYLNEKNPVFMWLISQGFKISSIQSDLEYDLINKDLLINENDAKVNEKLYYKLMATDHNEEFIKNLKKI